MKITLVMLLLLLSACVPKSDLDTANQQIAQLQQQVAQLQQQNTQLQQQVTAAEAQLARKPKLPIKVGCRKALMGPGLVATFSTTIKDGFPILVTWQSKSLGTSQQFRLNLSGASVAELGFAEGAAIEAEDTLTVENNNYEAAKFSCQ